MEIVRMWLPPAVVGLVVSIGGVGVAEVAGLTPAPVEPSPRATPATKAEPLPAQIEAAEAITVRGPWRTGEPEPEPEAEEEEEEDPEQEQEPEQEPEEPDPEQEQEQEPEPEQEPEQEPEPTPRPTQTPSPELSMPPDPSSTPTPSPTVELASAAPTPAPTLPAQGIGLTNWKLTLPTGESGSPTEVRQPQLAQFSAPGAFWLDGARQGVVFRAAAGGVTTENSSYPRSELREMTAAGATEAGWSNAVGAHVMSITQAITALPAAKPHVVAGQVHDADDDVIMIRLEGSRLFVESDGDEVALLDPAYQLGTKFTVEIKATPAGIAVSYNGSPVVALSTISQGLYFKAGCYTQSNPSKGDSPESYGEVVIYALTVSHS
jgi:poly(beta-D-mannuronate) lyase